MGPQKGSTKDQVALGVLVGGHGWLQVCTSETHAGQEVAPLSPFPLYCLEEDFISQPFDD